MYRDERAADLAEFTKHVQIAETLYVVHLEQYEQLNGDWEVEQACARSWRGLWEQLAQACAIAAKRGRDVSRVLAARRRANPDAVERWVSRANREATLHAFAEIRRCLPEVVVPTEIPTPWRSVVLPDPPRVRLAAAIVAIVICALGLCARM